MHATQRRGARLAVALGIVLAAAAIANGLWRGVRARALAPAHAHESPAVDSLPDMTLERANRLAIERVTAHHFIESLPYFHREFAALDHEVWGLRYDYGTVLFDAGFQVRTRRGVIQSAARSTLERVALLRESLAELNRAEIAAVRPVEVARTRERRAHVQWSWGLRWDAMRDYRAALTATPAAPSIARTVERCTASMRNPAVSDGADESELRP